MARSSDDDQIAAWRALLLAQNVVLRAIDYELDLDGLVPLHWYDVLRELNNAPDHQLRVQDLAGRVVLSRARISRLVDEMTEQRLVSREPDPTDGRASLVTLRPGGRAALKRAAPVYLAGIREHFTSHLSAAERATLVGALERVVAAHAHTTIARKVRR
jgi:DNA-binding MarR family transcriptional regulator